MAQDDWGDVVIGFMDADNGERIMHPNLSYSGTYETTRFRHRVSELNAMIGPTRKAEGRR